MPEQALAGAPCPPYKAGMGRSRVKLYGFVVLCLFGTGACDGSEPAEPVAPVVVIGIDGLEPSLISELLEAGRLPNLAKFAEHGVLGRLESMIPTYSPVIWTSIATGQAPNAHGITFFHDEENRPYTSNARKVPALWNIASDAGRTVNCVGWWNTWPAETINGKMLSTYAAQAQASVIWKPGVWENLEELTWPPNLMDEIQSEMIFVSDAARVRDILWQSFPEPRDQDPSTEQRDISEVMTKSVTDLGWSLSADLSSTAVAIRLQEQYPADLSMVYLSMPDVAGHRFWSYHEPEFYNFELKEPAKTDFAEYIRLAYVETDRQLGELLDSLPANASVLVLSDHGMHAWEDSIDDPEAGSTGHHPAGPPGIFAALGPLITNRGNLLGEQQKGDLGHVLEVAPLVLRMLGIAVPEHWPAMRGSLTLEQVLDERWRRAHPMARAENTDGSYRPATASLLPTEDVDDQFRKVFSGLGYALGDEAREESEKAFDEARGEGEDLEHE